MTAGHEGTPLAETLGLKRGMRCWFHNMPESVRAAIDPGGVAIEEQPTASDGLQCAHLFVTVHDKLERELTALHPLMASNGFVWISWPRQGDTDISEEAVHALALPRGLEAAGACSLDDDWAALKLVARKGPR